MSAALTPAERRLYVTVLGNCLTREPYQVNDAVTEAALAVHRMRQMQQSIVDDLSTLPDEVQIMFMDAME